MPGIDDYIIPFYYPDKADVWHDRYGSGILANFFLLPSPIAVSLAGITAEFTTSEAAYQCLKWWDNEEIRTAISSCTNGEQAFALRCKFEKERGVPATWKMAASQLPPDSVNKWSAMGLVLAVKFADPTLKAGLLATGDALLVERCEIRGRDAYWSDNGDGSGENRLGLLLMQMRQKYLQEEGAELPPPLFRGFEGNEGKVVDDGAFVPDGWQDAIRAASLRIRKEEDAIFGPVRWHPCWDIQKEQEQAKAAAATATTTAATRPQIVAMCGAILDLVAEVDDALIVELGAIPGGAKRVSLEEFRKVAKAVEAKGTYMVGGVSQNAVRIAQWMGKKTTGRGGNTPVTTGFIGFALGGEPKGDIIARQTVESGIKARLAIDMDSETTTVIALIPPSGDRALVFTDGAPSPEFAAANWELVMQDPPCRELLDGCEILYVGGWFTLISPPLLFAAVEAHLERGGKFAYNLAGKPLFQEPTLSHVKRAISSASYVFGNEDEFLGLGVALGLEEQDLTRIATHIARLEHPYQQQQSSTAAPFARTVVVTRGANPTLAVVGDRDETEPTVLNVDVLPVDEGKTIVDTVGAGDAFVGGFLVGVVSGQGLRESIEAGHYAAKCVLSARGCNIPPGVAEYEWK